MKKLLSLLLLASTLCFMASCGDDEEESSDCAGLLSTGGTIDIDGETLNLNLAQLLISSGFDGDIYSFQIGGLSSDCNNIKSLSFSIEITTDSDLNGSYTIKDFFDAGLNDAYGVTIADQTVTPLSQSLTEIKSGTLEITKHAARDYTIDMSGSLVGGGTVEVSFRNKF